MVAAGLSLPGAVVKSILKRSGLLVKVVVPCGLTITVLSSGSGEGRGSREFIKRGKGLSVDILGDQWNVAVKAKTIDLVRNRIRRRGTVRNYIPG